MFSHPTSDAEWVAPSATPLLNHVLMSSRVVGMLVLSFSHLIIGRQMEKVNQIVGKVRSADELAGENQQ